MPEGIVFFSFTFATLPVIGLYFSLRCRNFFAALVCTILAGWVLPSAAPILASLAQKAWLGANFLRLEFYLHWPDEPPMLWLPMAQGFAAILCGHRLSLNLRQRRFALGKGSAQS
jgi:hypothetical protein